MTQHPRDERHTVSDRLSRGPCSRYLPDPDDSCRFTFSRLLSVSLTLCRIPRANHQRKHQKSGKFRSIWTGARGRRTYRGAAVGGHGGGSGGGRAGARVLGAEGRLETTATATGPVGGGGSNGRWGRSDRWKFRCRKCFCYAATSYPRAVLDMSRGPAVRVSEQLLGLCLCGDGRTAMSCVLEK